MSLRIRRGTESQRQTTTFDLGEIAYTTDSKKLFVGDGVTVGGVNVLKTTAGAGLSWNDSTQQLDISGTNLSTSNITEGTNLYFTTDRAQDASASLFTHNVGHSNISFTYDDTLNKILATVSLDGVGIASVSADTSPALGGNLNLSTHSISGTGSIDITGNITATTLNGKLGSDLDLNTHNISGTGGIDITGNIISNNITVNNLLTINATTAGKHTDIYGITSGIYPTGDNIHVARGTISTPLTVHLGDLLDAKYTLAHDGTNYVAASTIVSLIDSNAQITTGAIPGSIGIFTFNDGNLDNPHGILIDSRGYVSINHGLTAPVATLDINGFAKLAILTSAPSTLIDGIIAIADGTSWNPLGHAGKKQLVIYLGGNWQQISIQP
jgi:hypothetical protein